MGFFVFIFAALAIINCMTDPLDNMESTNGRIEDLQSLRTLEAIFNVQKTNAFGTTNPELFKANLESMGIADLQSIASKVGVNRYLSVPELKDHLMRAFERDMRGKTNSFNAPVAKKVNNFDYQNPRHLALMRSLGMKTH